MRILVPRLVTSKENLLFTIYFISMQLDNHVKMTAKRLKLIIKGITTGISGYLLHI